MSMENLLGGFLDQSEQINQDLVEGKVQVKIMADEFYEDGHDFTLTYLQPQPGESWVLKVLPNIENTNGADLQGNIGTHSVYKKLPDPDRAGKTFRYTSSGNSDTCPALALFFDLYKKGEDGDILAKQKYKKHLPSSNEACVVVQVISGPKPEDTGKIRLLVYHTSGVGTDIANLMKNKLAPVNKRLKPENIFDLFGSSLLYLECVLQKFAEGGEGRSFAASSWSTDEKSGALLPMNDGTWVPLSKDLIDPATRDFKDPAHREAFAKLIEMTKDTNISIHNQFSYKTATDPRNTESTSKYVKDTYEKMMRVIPIIRDAQSLDEIDAKLNIGKTGEGNAEMIGDATTQDVLKSGAADVLGTSTTFGGQQEQNSTPAQTPVDTTVATQQTPAQTQATETAPVQDTGAANFQNMLDQAGN